MTEKKTKKKKSKVQEELEIENKRLKDELRKVAIHLKDLQERESTGDFTHLAVGCSVKDGKFHIDRIKYNPKTKEGILESSDEVKPNSKSYAGLCVNVEKIAGLEVTANIEIKEKEND